ncbi:hypothetical protein GCM10022226_44570 [Sphaerisporangium flaviroseum]|uniref:Uncharacterized protein n=1 Tax=Sphaerisporangium flaviroseum TaxID=509199 RepID=A0ABP7IIK4_9ACTN
MCPDNRTKTRPVTERRAHPDRVTEEQDPRTQADLRQWTEKPPSTNIVWPVM